MSRLSSSMFGFAAAAIIGAASFQFASGEAFGFSGKSLVVSAAQTASVVNRSAKADRAPLAASSGRGATLIYQFSTLPSISFATRYDAAQQSAPLAPVVPARKLAACEVSVSVLTDLADQLAPGRCVT